MQYSIVFLSEIRQTFELRMDAEYWRPVFIKNSKLISEQKKITDFTIQDISNIKSNPIERDFEYLEISKIPLNSFEYETTQIHKGEEPDRAHYILRKNDVAVSTVRPKRNAVALIQKDEVIGSSGLAILRTQSIEPEYLFAFCKTDYFIKCLMRANKASMYPAISNKDILDMPLFVPSEKFREKIKENIQKALSWTRKSKKLLAEAQSLLLSELNLTDWKPKHRLSFIRRYSDIEQAGRLDAEYFQPKYEDIINKIKAYKGGWDTLQKLVFVKDDNFKPEKEVLYKYIELSDISNNSEIIGYITEKGKNLPNRAKRIVSKGDVVISSIEGSLSKIALIDQEYDKAICSNGFYVINSTKLNSETILLLMKSIVGQLQLKKGCSGMILNSISKDEFYKIAFPILDTNIQAQIQNAVTESLSLYNRSKKLLEYSKHTVEKAIEQDEKSALAWLKNKLSKISQLI